MGTDLFGDILSKFRALLTHDELIDEEMAQKICDSIADGKCTRESIEPLLKTKATKINANTQD
jgi:hypothetical protein